MTGPMRPRAASTLAVRPALPPDQTFLYDLHSAIRGPEFHLAPIDATQKEHLIRMQIHAHGAITGASEPGAGERGFEFRSEFFNVFNTTSFANPLNILESGTAGQIVSTSTGPRVIQFALKWKTR
jgi:hypothetical protein